MEYFCTCPRGVEPVLLEELKEIAQKSRTLTIQKAISGGIFASGTIEDAWRLNLHSRIASRILMKVAKGNYQNESDIYKLVMAQSWERFFDAKQTIRVDVNAIKSPLKSLQFITLKIKDAVADYFRDKVGSRPSVNTKAPDIHIVAFLAKEEITLYLDTSGESLFKRGWRTKTGDAPLRENLAAALLRASGWKPGMVLFDPMCGSGTILAEAAHMLMGVPPGMNRSFAFEKLKSFNMRKWEEMKKEVKLSPLPDKPTLFGSDISGDMVRLAKGNFEVAKITYPIILKQVDAKEVQVPTEEPGIILTNPPYGERIDVRGEKSKEADEVTRLFYQAFSTTLKQRFSGWKVFLFTADLDTPKMLRLKESKKTPFYNGPIECRLFRFDMVAGSNRKKA